MVRALTFLDSALAVTSLLCTVCSASPVDSAYSQRRAAPGSVILIGGALEQNNTAVWSQIIQAGGGSAGKFGILTAGSIPKSQDPDADDPENCANSECNGNFYAGVLKELGAGSAEWIPVDLDNKAAAEDPQLAEKVRGYTGFFIGGGDQTRYSDLLFKADGKTDTALLAAIRAAVNGGAGIAGTSAGAAIMQAGQMVTGGESYYGVRDGSAPDLSDNPDQLTYRTGGGFGLFNAGLADTHFAARGRQGRIIRLLMDTKNTVAFGVDEDTALVASGNSLSVLGTNNVHVFSVKDATSGDSGDWSIRTARWSMLSSGDKYDATTGQITHGSGTVPYSGEPGSVSFQTKDVLSSPDNIGPDDGRASPYEMVKLALDLVKSKDSKSTSGETFETDPVYRVSLSTGRDFEAWRSNTSGKISFRDIVVDIDSAD